MPALLRFLLIFASAAAARVFIATADAAALEPQPFAAQARRLIEATDAAGEPIIGEDRAVLDKALADPSAPGVVEKIQEILDKRCLFFVHINPEARVKATQGPVKAELIEHGWRLFFVKVTNEAGSTALLQIVSPNARAVGNWRKVRTESDQRLVGKSLEAPLPPNIDLWLDLQPHDVPPLKPTLSGLETEYRLVQLYSRDAGKREARFLFDIGQGTQDLGFRNEVDVLFHASPARDVVLRVKDEHGAPAMGSFVFRDRRGRVCPSQVKRLAPDFGFHPQIYREDGEKVRLPDGDYDIEFSRGPESLPEIRSVKIGPETPELAFQVKRWIDPAKLGWWSGDHHIHAAGCAHYTKPTEGVHAPDMARHCRGEDLKIGANLTWGPCFDYQKQFFTGVEDVSSRFPYLLRYDVEVSGFGSHKSGHLCLLRLREQMYPGGDSSTHWPTLGLNTLRWAQKQGAVCGPAHSGNGLQVDTDEIPNFLLPKFDGIGANEYIVDVTHEVEGPDGKLVPAIDFMSAVDTSPISELNMWYHTLNAGYRTRISGETDFPCITGERVGLGRSYVKLSGKLSYDAWCEGIEAGRCYVSDGQSHLLDFQVNGLGVGEGASEVRLPNPGRVQVKVKAAALLGAKPSPNARLRRHDFWDLERARIGATRDVPVEVIVNGRPVERKVIPADGQMRDLAFDVNVERSSWIAVRVLPSSHTNPVFVPVGDKPIRASRKSIEWCLQCVDQCWSQKKPFIAPVELKEAEQAYEHARQTYRQRLAEADAE